MKTKKELIKEIAYWLDLTYTPKYSYTALNLRINDKLSVTAVSRTKVAFVEDNTNTYDRTMSSKEVTTEMLQSVLNAIIGKYQ